MARLARVIVVTAECCNRLVALVDVHCLYNLQIVIKRDDCIDKGNEYQQMETCIEGCHEDEELGEEAGKRRDACE